MLSWELGSRRFQAVGSQIWVVAEHRHPPEAVKQTSVVEELHHPLQPVRVVLEGLLEGLLEEPPKGEEERAGALVGSLWQG